MKNQILTSAFFLACVAGLASMASVSGAAAQQVIRTHDGTFSWSDTTFANASDFYQAFESYNFSFGPTSRSIALVPNFLNFNLSSSGGITATQTGPISGAIVPIQYSSNNGGILGWSYDTAADTSGSELLTLGVQNGLATLNYNHSGFDSFNGNQFYTVFIRLPGDWTTHGTSTGDFELNGVGAGFSTVTTSFDSALNQTFVMTQNSNYTGGFVLNFTLFGSPVAAVPEPSTWAMMLIGFAGLGFAFRQSRRRASLA
jgi:hypothetical protein